MTAKRFTSVTKLADMGLWEWGFFVGITVYASQAVRVSLWARNWVEHSSVYPRGRTLFSHKISVDNGMPQVI